jgi:hypothetical protein
MAVSHMGSSSMTWVDLHRNQSLLGPCWIAYSFLSIKDDLSMDLSDWHFLDR